MLELIKIKTFFDNSIKLYQKNDISQLQKGSIVKVQTFFGIDLAEVVCPKLITMSEEKWNQTTKKNERKSHFVFSPVIIDIATDQEIELHKQYQQDIVQYQAIFKEEITNHQLDLTIVKLYYTLSKDKIICLYTSPTRIDFRKLVRSLGYRLKQRIELFQLSIPTTTLFPPNTLGSCCRSLCCQLFNSEKCRKSSSSCNITKSAKNLGCCGKIKCCLFQEEHNKV